MIIPSDDKTSLYTIIPLVVLVLGGIMSAVGYFKYRKLLNFLDKIAKAASAVKDGDFSKRVPEELNDEIPHLGENINKMIYSLQDRENKIIEYQKALHRQKEYLEAIFNSLVDGIITISKDCLITKINPTAVIWFGEEEKNILNRRLSDFISCGCNINFSQNDKSIHDNCSLFSLNERLDSIEVKILNSNSNIEKTFELCPSPLSGVEDEQAYVIVLRDITELKEINTMREDFVAALSHDLRVPILAEANTLKFFLKERFGPLAEKQIVAIENMLESNDEMLRLVTNLLDSYKFDAGEFELLKEPSNIKKLAQDCISELSPLAEKNNQSINNLISPDIPNLYLDKNEIKRVIKNLLNNAIAYTEKNGNITIDAEYNNDQVIIKVNDNGKGIQESELQNIFQRFYSKAKKFRKIGTGLGLYISKKIVEKHNGRIWVESRFGEGSTFYFSLPVFKL